MERREERRRGEEEREEQEERHTRSSSGRLSTCFFMSFFANAINEEPIRLPTFGTINTPSIPPPHSSSLSFFATYPSGATVKYTPHL